jgi:LDH2 family malate/lactate/ureidoglycolate dehydrogenase
VRVDHGRPLLESVFRRAGLPPAEAATVADAIIEAELRGRSTHGFVRVRGLVEQIRRGGFEPVRIDRDGGHWLRVDGGNGIGYLVADRAMELAIERAAGQGTALVAVHRATHAGMLGYYAEKAARQGFVGLAACDCSPRVAPYGSSEALFGTNPLAIAIPAEPNPILLDMSTAAITNGELLLAKRQGTRIDPTLAFDRQGRPTDDPEAALAGAVVAFGGHKGAGLALAIQILTSALVGAATVPAPGTDYGYLIAAIDPAIFTDREAFLRDVTALADRIRSARPAPGHAHVLLPGDRTWLERADRLRDGLTVEGSLWREIESLAAE